MSIETAFARVPVGGGSFHVCTEAQVVAVVRAALDRGVGGRIVTPNVDILRQATRDAEVRGYLADASLVVADGMPLVWASRLAGTPLPERVCGSSLIWSLAAGLGRDGRSVYVLGGEPALPAVRQRTPAAPAGPAASPEPTAPAAPPEPTEPAGPAAPPAPAPLRPAPHATRADRAARLGFAEARAAGFADAEAAFPPGLPAGPPSDGARRAAERLAAASPGLRVAGCHSPAFGFDRDPAALAEVCRRVVEAAPDLVYVGIGFPRQERVIDRLRSELPFTWFLGCGAAVNFVAGDRRRAPRWMQRTGLEWVHRLTGEPGRLAGRYLRHDAPYAIRLLVRSWSARRVSR